MKKVNLKEVECYTCLGTGYIFEGEDENKADYIVCPDCEGTGLNIIGDEEFEEYEDINNLFI